MRRWGRWLAIGVIALGVLAVAPARALPVGPEGGGRFAIAAPVAGGPQVRTVDAADGTAIYTQTWLPVARDGDVPPVRLPTVVVYTPYATPGVPDAPDLIELLVPQGYAVTFANVRGTGASGGCFTLAGSEEIDDGARVIEDAGVLAPWASGRVGMFGASYPGGTQLATATGPDRERLSSLKALVVGAPSATLYDVVHHDGVPHFLAGPGNALVYLAALTSPTADLSHIADRVGCQVEVFAGVAVPSGDYDDFYADRDHVAHLERLTAATFMFHGTADRRVPPIMQAGLFDRIPDDVEKFGLFGVWGHELPPVEDFDQRVVAWFDHHLRGIDTGVTEWPTARVQATDGTWRDAPSWPIAEANDQMLLGPAGTLDAGSPAGSTTYLESPVPETEAPPLPGALPGVSAVFETEPASEAFTTTGMTTLDLWVELQVPDAHITARLEVIGTDGSRIVPAARTMGARSAQHLDAFDRGRFRQATPIPAPVGEPVLVPIRLDPIDLAVPAGARLRLTIAGSSIGYDGLDGVTPGLGAVFQGPTWPSGLVAPVTILHDADRPSALSLTSSRASVPAPQTGPYQSGGVTDVAAGSAPSAPRTAGSLPATGGSAPMLAAAVLAMAGAVVLATVHRSRTIR